MKKTALAGLKLLKVADLRSGHELPTAVRRIIAVCAGMPKDSVADTRTLARLVGLSMGTIHHWSAERALEPYRHFAAPCRCVWGRREVIARLNRSA